MKNNTEMDQKMRATYEQMLADAKAPGSGCSKEYIQHLQDVLTGHKPLFVNHQYLLSAMTHRDEKNKLIKENEDRLSQCNQHRFDERVSDFLHASAFFSKKWKCAHCRGTVSDEQKHWYELGLAQAQTTKKEETTWN